MSEAMPDVLTFRSAENVGNTVSSLASDDALPKKSLSLSLLEPNRNLKHLYVLESALNFNHTLATILPVNTVHQEAMKRLKSLRQRL